MRRAAEDRAESRRAMDRFHPRPAHIEPSRFDGTSWAEWLYFNGRSADGSLRFYLTSLMYLLFGDSDFTFTGMPK